MRLLIAGILSLVIYLLSCAWGQEKKEVPQATIFHPEVQHFPCLSPHKLYYPQFDGPPMLTP